ncbi:hypothetical protein Q5424_00250 [Conexibacter sp. JD483]|uniref:hypothetical protein n=1 Tax=unclassified Conexibacter TaxID=2627773 RepID=UPI00271B0B44|nr:MULTISPECIES: hypothetical protein [unclassified Conexibacter]MDO8184205.1 hypothetical protein [Conexibacter sp. CPCC 205706]MDO8197197.1 hypothetical protein [Conexibacter sp. CPCC 205762]MDR9367488.1 hypothetical protein [Conexibacter sp. JD483]
MEIVSVGEHSVCRHYRSFVPIEGLAELGHRTAVCAAAGRGLPRELDDPPELARADVILGYRMLFNNVRAIRREIARGAAFVWDTDDDLANLPRDSATFKAIGQSRVAELVQRTAQLARLADVVTTTTTQLARKYQRLGVRRVVVIPNYLSSGAVRPPRVPQTRDEVTIGWVAGGEHRVDAKKVPVVKALRRLLAAHPNVRVESAGVALPLPAERYRHYEWVEIARLPDLCARWDIGLAPLSDIPFNRARSDVKLKEYAAVGLPWLASPVGPYKEMGETEGGQLIPDYGWYDALERLFTDPAERAVLSARASAWAATQSIDGNARLWESVCEEALRRRRSRAGAVG